MEKLRRFIERHRSGHINMPHEVLREFLNVEADGSFLTIPESERKILLGCLACKAKIDIERAGMHAE
ncbi:MAG: hypothetical protein AAB495_02520 [Patescibacteria group bacterium]